MDPNVVLLDHDDPDAHFDDVDGNVLNDVDHDLGVDYDDHATAV